MEMYFKYCHELGVHDYRRSLDWWSEFIALIHSTRNYYKQYSAIADLHTLKFTVTPTD
jgi:hypothetical protein